ncbi:DUF4239 domain-containing protein [Microvirga massiliensis]|uniref:bestrophin-like domain n=1 Tax=Microvirga massiliensis TaxID=1033741 RepID=UPI00062BC008|nr:DUF4239 domain-containing protein [Microvirga massiliensis]
MMTAILELPTWLGCGLAVLAGVVCSVLPLVAVRWFMTRELNPKTREVAETVAVRVGTVHALILALVFAEAQSTHTDLQQQVSKEVTALEHVALRLDQWNGPEEDALINQLAAYVRAVLQTEWQVSLHPDGSTAAKQAYNNLDAAILDLPADSPRQQALRDRMISDMDTLQEHRRDRLSLFHRAIPGLFWWMALAGFAITVLFFFVFPETPLHIAMLGVYGAYTGLVLYFILALSHPYVGPAAIDTSPYEMVLETELSPRPSAAMP